VIIRDVIAAEAAQFNGDVIIVVVVLILVITLCVVLALFFVTWRRRRHDNRSNRSLHSLTPTLSGDNAIGLFFCLFVCRICKKGRICVKFSVVSNIKLSIIDIKTLINRPNKNVKNAKTYKNC